MSNIKQGTLTSRSIPSVDAVISHTALALVIDHWGLASSKLAVRQLQENARKLENIPDWAGDAALYAQPVHNWLVNTVGHGYRHVFNLTGTVIHTNLGRSLLSDDMMKAAIAASTLPVALEYDIETGRRGDREGIVEHRLKLLTGAQAATVVNNNAAAVMLVLNTLALNRSVPVSRGELVEIGGSFRIPDIMERAGCHLVEVGTTNRTHSRDYANAVDGSTSLLLKVHPSNYHVEGFTKTVEVRELKKIGAAHNLPLCVDLGSGTLIDLKRYGLPHEPTPKEILAEGADLVTFSGDKLLGSVQAGIIIGRADLIAMLNSNPLKRALRADKITLSILDTTLRAYENEDTLVENIPLLRTLTLSPSILDSRAKAVSEKLKYLLPEYAISIEDSTSQLGSGALPEARLPSRAVTIRSDIGSNTIGIEKKLRRLAVPVIGRLQEGRLWLDMRGADPIEELITNLEALV